MNNEIHLVRPPDPEALGRIHSIVEKAHIWGGDGKHPLFRKIRKVLMEKHPDVITKSFGGNPDVAAAWIKNNWYRMRGQEPPPTRGDGKINASIVDQFDDIDQYAPIDDAVVKQLILDEGITHELFFDSAMSAPTEADGLIWKDSLRTGTWAVNPNGSGKPFIVTKHFLDQLVYAFEDGAYEFVTVPKTHADQVDENTGFTKKLLVKPDPDQPGGYVLRSGLHFTDKSIKEKVLDGSIANVSCGIDVSGYKRIEDGKVYPAVLKHIALTNKPFINKLRPFGSTDMIAASQDWEGSYLMSSTDTNTEKNVLQKFFDRFRTMVTDMEAEIATSETVTTPAPANEGVEPQTNTVDNPVDPPAETTVPAVTNENNEGGDPMANNETPNEEVATTPVAPAANEAPATVPTTPEVPAATPALAGVALSQDDIQRVIDAEVARQVGDVKAQVIELSQTAHKNGVAARVAALSASGLAPVIVLKAQEIMLADTRKTGIIALSADGVETTLTATDIVESLLAVIPGIVLSAPGTDVALSQSTSRPDDTNNQLDPQAAADAEYKSLFPDSK